MEALIKIEHLSKSFDETEVLKDISLAINKGEVVAIIGSSGGGKSTLLRCLNLLEQPTSGKILIDGQNILDPSSNVDKLRTKMGMVFQSFNLFNHLSVIDNCMVAPRKVLKLSKQEAKDRATENLAKVGLLEKAPYKVLQLSGGQKQRVAIARALCMKPKVLLFDEPTSALDPEMIDEVLTIMKKLADEGMTMIVVTHEMGFAKNVATRLIFIDKGVIKYNGIPKSFFEGNEDSRINQFIGTKTT